MVFATAYDQIFDAIDREVATFVHSRLPSLQSDADVRWFIEERLLRTMAQAAWER